MYIFVHCLHSLFLPSFVVHLSRFFFLDFFLVPLFPSFFALPSVFTTPFDGADAPAGFLNARVRTSMCLAGSTLRYLSPAGIRAWNWLAYTSSSWRIAYSSPAPTSRVPLSPPTLALSSSSTLPFIRSRSTSLSGTWITTSSLSPCPEFRFRFSSPSNALGFTLTKPSGGLNLSRLLDESLSPTANFTPFPITLTPKHRQYGALHCSPSGLRFLGCGGCGGKKAKGTGRQTEKTGDERAT
mmetsp:Transcript_5718/g.17302  ORF Transcript_5718/g.17302 Transcript_5718/m.17302 type:complete len:240 (-) Transcript_5718:628-1347(-)